MRKFQEHKNGNPFSCDDDDEDLEPLRSLQMLEFEKACVPFVVS